MSLLFVCGLLAVMVLSAAAGVVVDRAISKRGGHPLESPEFAARRQRPRALTRLSKDHFTWEI